MVVASLCHGSRARTQIREAPSPTRARGQRRRAQSRLHICILLRRAAPIAIDQLDHLFFQMNFRNVQKSGKCSAIFQNYSSGVSYNNDYTSSIIHYPDRKSLRKLIILGEGQSLLVVHYITVDDRFSFFCRFPAPTWSSSSGQRKKGSPASTVLLHRGCGAQRASWTDRLDGYLGTGLARKLLN